MQTFRMFASEKDTCGAKLHLGAFDYVLSGGRTTLASVWNLLEKMMHGGLEEALRLMGLNPPAGFRGLPFTVRRQMAQKAQERLAERIAGLSDWHERLTSKTQPIPLARHERKISSLNIKSTSQEQKAS